jgi:hypothetical protein
MGADTLETRREMARISIEDATLRRSTRRPVESIEERVTITWRLHRSSASDSIRSMTDRDVAVTMLIAAALIFGLLVAPLLVWGLFTWVG